MDDTEVSYHENDQEFAANQFPVQGRKITTNIAKPITITRTNSQDGTLNDFTVEWNCFKLTVSSHLVNPGTGHPQRYFNIYVRPSQAMYDHTKGILGTYNSNPADDKQTMAGVIKTNNFDLRTGWAVTGAADLFDTDSNDEKTNYPGYVCPGQARKNDPVPTPEQLENAEEGKTLLCV